jgi:adenylosuccinate lyase
MSDTLPTATRVSDAGIRALYRLENRWQAWLDVEVALAKAQAELGIIPNEAAAAIAAAARIELLDRARIDEGFARTGHTLVPLVWELSRVVGEPHGGWVHWGATTQNITQTGDLLVLRQAHRVFLRLIGEVLAAMADLAERGAEMPIAGRTHGQHAVPAYLRIQGCGLDR